MNLFRVMTQFLLAEGAKEMTSYRKQLREPNWSESLFSCKRSAAFCDDANVATYLRGYFDPQLFATRACACRGPS